MKKLISGILCTFILMFGMVPVYAAVPIATNANQQVTLPFYSYSLNTTLNINQGLAICEGTIIVYSSTIVPNIKVAIALYLEGRTSSIDQWTTVASGSKSFNSNIGTFQMIVTLPLMYHQYRVRAAYRINDGSGTVNILDYSNIVNY